MEIGKTLTVTTRKAWRAWLQKHHATAPEIWLVYWKKESGRKRIPYNDAVEEALCFGWIDSILKPIDDERYAQRFSPRKPRAKWSEMNKERARRLIADGKMTKAGLAALGDALDGGEVVVAPDIRAALRKAGAWKNFEAFPASYKRIRIGWIEGARHRPEIFETRLRYFVKMTAQNKQYGMVR